MQTYYRYIVIEFALHRIKFLYPHRKITFIFILAWIRRNIEKFNIDLHYDSLTTKSSGGRKDPLALI